MPQFVCECARNACCSGAAGCFESLRPRARATEKTYKQRAQPPRPRDPHWLLACSAATALDELYSTSGAPHISIFDKRVWPVHVPPRLPHTRTDGPAAAVTLNLLAQLTAPRALPALALAPWHPLLAPSSQAPAFAPKRSSVSSPPSPLSRWVRPCPHISSPRASPFAPYTRTDPAGASAWRLPGASGSPAFSCFGCVGPGAAVATPGAFASCWLLQAQPSLPACARSSLAALPRPSPAAASALAPSTPFSPSPSLPTLPSKLCRQVAVPAAFPPILRRFPLVVNNNNNKKLNKTLQ